MVTEPGLGDYVLREGRVVHVPRRAPQPTSTTTTSPSRKEETPLEQYLRGLWEEHRFKWRGHVTPEDRANFGFTVPTEEDEAPQGAPHLKPHTKLHNVVFSEPTTPAPTDLLKEILKQPKMDAPITEAELHFAPHLNPTPGEMTPTGHYH